MKTLEQIYDYGSCFESTSGTQGKELLDLSKAYYERQLDTTRSVLNEYQDFVSLHCPGTYRCDCGQLRKPGYVCDNPDCYYVDNN